MYVCPRPQPKHHMPSSVGTRVGWMLGGDPCGRPSFLTDTLPYTVCGRPSFPHTHVLQRNDGTISSCSEKDAHKGPHILPSSARVPTYGRVPRFSLFLGKHLHIISLRFRRKAKWTRHKHSKSEAEVEFAVLDFKAQRFVEANGGGVLFPDMQVDGG